MSVEKRTVDDLHPICIKCIHSYKEKMVKLGIAEDESSVKWKLPCDFVYKSDIDPDEIYKTLSEAGVPEPQIMDEIYRLNPILFCNEVFDMGVDKNGNRKSLNPFEYQEEFLLCSCRKIVQRLARRMGKTVGMDLKILHFACFAKNKKVIVFTPFKQQALKIFTDLENLANRSEYIKSKIVKFNGSDRLFKKNPLEMRFTNGTTIIGFSIASQQKEKSAAMRGEGVRDFDGTGGMMVGDEIDFLTEKSWQVINAMINEEGLEGETVTVFSSTPIGKREQFYKMCQGALSQYYKEIYRTIFDKPGMDLDQIKLIRESCMSEEEWNREYLALFGEQINTEFTYEDLMLCKYKAIIKYPPIPFDELGNPDWANASYIPPTEEGAIRMIGIDWNGDKIGTRFLVVEYRPSIKKYVIIGRYSIERGKFKQLMAIDTVRTLNRMFLPHSIYADYGFGDTQVQRLHQIASLATPGTPDNRLARMKAIHMQKVTEVWDQALREKVSKENKPFMIEIAKGIVEQHDILISRHEFDLDEQQACLVPNLLKFKRKTTVHGRPTWPLEDDHDAIALSLALMAFIVETSDVCKRPAGMATLLFSPLSSGDTRITSEQLKTIYGDLLTHNVRASGGGKQVPSDRTSFLTPNQIPKDNEVDGKQPNRNVVKTGSKLPKPGRRTSFFGRWRP